MIREGYPDQTKTFDTKADAARWSRSVETEMDKGLFVSITEAQRTTLGEIIERYLREVSPHTKSASEDKYRLTALAKKNISKWSMANLSAAKVAEFRDERLKEVSAGTVIRELAYISLIINHARREWGINIPNPVALVRKPPTPPGRSRTLKREERELLLHELESTGRKSIWMRPLVALALETAMRRGELLSLLWVNINFEGRTAYLQDTKNGESRMVPLSVAAVDLLKKLPRTESEFIFPIKSCTVEAAFKRAVNRIGLTNIRFHDLRHTAITNMASKLPNIIELSAVSGHKSLAMLKRYYHPDATALALKLG